MNYLFIICLIIIGFLGYKLFQKQKIDKEILEKYQSDIEKVRHELQELEVHSLTMVQKATQERSKYEEYKREREYEEHKLKECKEDLQATLDTYNDIVDNKMKAIDESFEEQRQKRQHDLDLELEAKTVLVQREIEDKEKYCENTLESFDKTIAEKYQEATDQIDAYNKQVADSKERFESIQKTLRQYELDKQAKLYYTIQLPDEFKDDIEFLLTTVAAKVQHPDIISKLVWAEYVKPYIEETFKRIEIRPEAGIYKLTNIETGKAYIGKSTNVKTRISDHFKSSIGIKSIADQAVHHAILKEGFWNWSIEIITYCDKEQLSELEKYYIDFFKTQEFGYNKNAGG